MLVRILLALALIALIVPHHLLIAGAEGGSSLPVFLVDQLAVLGLTGLVLLALESALSGIARRDDKYYAVIIAFGFLAGAIAGLFAFAIWGEKEGPVPYETFLRGARSLLFGGLVGTAIYVVWRTVLNGQRQISVSRAEWYGAAAVLLLAVLGLAVWFRNFDTAGGQIATLSLGSIDWIGVGGCRNHGSLSEICRLTLLDDVTVRRFAWTTFGIFWVLVALYYMARLKLSRVRALTMVSLIALGSIIAYFTATTAFEHLLQGKSGSMLGFCIGMVGVIIGHSWFLSWCREQALVEALTEAFGTQDALRAMVRARLETQIGKAPIERATLAGEVKALVQRADHDGWLGQLVLNAQYSRPDDRKIEAIARSMGLGIAPPDVANLRKTANRIGKPELAGSQAPATQLETIVREESQFTDPDDYHTRLARIGFCVCRVETPHNLGTGFLIGPDLVMTNFHVVKEYADPAAARPVADIVCQFDYKVAAGLQTLSRGTIFRVVEIVDSSPFSPADLEEGAVPQVDQLDFAILRLERPVGELAIGERAEAGAPLRGWIPMRSAAEKQNLTPDEIHQAFVIVLQHPKGQPMQQDMGAVTELNTNGTRIRHEANTLPGSSGSPCFSIRDLSIFALHHAGGHSKTLNRPYNQAVPIGKIINLVRLRGKSSAFWDKDPKK